MSKRSSNFAVRIATVCSLTGAAALIAVAIATGWSVPALAHDGGNFACRASALRAEGVVSVEPFVANDPATPCADDHAALIGEVTISDVRASALSADTVFVDRGNADGTVAGAFALTGSAGVADIVSADILSSEAEVGSVNGQCRVTSRSFVASATVLGQPVDLDGEHRDIPIPGVGTVHFNETLIEGNVVTQRALWFEPASLLQEEVVISESQVGFADQSSCQDDDNGQPPARAWMTGGGGVSSGNDRASHAFRLECRVDDSPNRLQINWGRGDKFHLESMTAAECSDDPAIDPGQPEASFDVHTGEGTGRYNGVSGATAEWQLTDAGEPGTDDSASLKVWGRNGTLVLDVSGNLDRGNHQAH